MLAAARHTVALRITEKTRKNYVGKMRRVALFMVSKPALHPHLSQNNEIIVPIPLNVVQVIFGWLGTDDNLAKKRKSSPAAASSQSSAMLPSPAEGDESDDDDEEDTDVHLVDGTSSSLRTVFDSSAHMGAIGLPDGGPQSASSATGNNAATGDNTVSISHSCMQGYKSALVWYCMEHGHKLDGEVNSWLDSFVHGYKKQVADKKARGVMCISEGKSALSFTGHVTLSTIFLTMKPVGKKSGYQEGVFGWVYQTLSWNMMARSNSVGSLTYHHIDWRNDCMLVTLAKHKGELSRCRCTLLLSSHSIH